MTLRPLSSQIVGTETLIQFKHQNINSEQTSRFGARSRTLKIYFAQIRVAPDKSSSAKHVQEINFNIPVVLFDSSG